MIPKFVIKFLENHPKLIWHLRYFRRNFQFLNTKNPRNLYEKIIQMSLQNTSDEWSILADKYAVREVVKERIGEQYLVPLYGVYDKAEDIDYDKLPNSFVLKTNNACATNIIVKDKSKIDKEEINKKITKWLKSPYGALTGQTHYSKIKPRIIAEKLLQQKDEKSLIDYKFFCVNGKPECVFVCKDRTINTHNVNVMFYDLNWGEIPEYVSSRATKIKNFSKPKAFDEMVDIVRKLCAPYKFVRVDLYEIDGLPIFGEYTFTPGIADFYFSALFHKNIFNKLK